MTEKIQFNRPFMTGKELYYIAEAKFGNMLTGDAPSRSGAMNGWSIKVAAKGVVPAEVAVGVSLLTYLLVIGIPSLLGGLLLLIDRDGQTSIPRG